MKTMDRLRGTASPYKIARNQNTTEIEVINPGLRLSVAPGFQTSKHRLQSKPNQYGGY